MLYAVLYRKDASGARWNPSQYDRKPTKAQRDHAAKVRSVTARVERPSLLDFLADGFYSLDAVPADFHKPANLLDYSRCGWIIPTDSLGKAGRADRSAVQSIVLWIKQNCGEMVNPAHVSILLLDDDGPYDLP